jgi:hypothetical protein
MIAQVLLGCAAGGPGRSSACDYLSSAAAKLGAANRHEAVQLARSRGWI